MPSDESVSIENPVDGASVPVESILCTEELRRRPSRAPDYEQESRALVALAQALADSPQTVLQILADTLLDVCRAGSAGVSLLTTDDGGKRFYWPAISGSWKSHIGGGTPRDFGPCGDVLDRNSTLLFTHVERRYTYFQPVQPCVEEALLVPFYVQGKAVGTIWAVAHDSGRKFDAEDERLMNTLGKFASSAYQTLASLSALSAQEEARQQTARANNLLAAVVDSSDDAIITKTLDGVITTWNKSAERLFGHTSEEAIGKHIFLVIPKERRDEEEKIIQQLKRGERVDHFETQRLRKDGTLIDLSLTISPVRDSSGNIVGASKVARDISLKKQAEQVNNLLAAVVDSTDDAIITKSLDGVITSWNKSAERLFGHTSEDAIGKHIFLIIPKERRDEEAKIIQRLKRGERVDHFETQRVRKDGTLVDLSLTISPVRDASGRVTGASKIARDVTDTKRVERALRQSEEKLRLLTNGLETQVHTRTKELEERNRDIVEQAEQLRELSNRVLKTQEDERRHIARELHDSAGQIIAALGMNLAGLNQRASNNPALAKALDDTQNLVQQLNREIRTTSYLLHPPLLDESGLSQAIQWYVQGLKERSGLEIDLVVSDDLGRLPADQELSLFRIVQESLTNIHRHSGSHTGTIRLSRNSDSISLQIQDYGKGLSAEKLVEIKANRAGIGLTGMRERVRHFNGQMDIQSNGTGTTVSVNLPILSTPPTESETVKQ